MNWQSILERVGGTAVIVAALAWLARSMFTLIINRDFERVRSDLAKESWHFQKSWTERERFFAGILTALYKLERALLACSEHFDAPGSAHDTSIEGSDEFRELTNRWNAAIEELHEQMGASSIHLPDRDYEKLEDLFSRLWDANQDSICTADFVRSSLKIVIELRKDVRLSARQALSVPK